MSRPIPSAGPRFAAMLAIALVACGTRSDDRKTDAAAAGDEDAAAQTAETASVQKQPTALPPERPSPFEAEYHVSAPDGGDLVSVKLTEKGATTTLGDREHRLVITYDVPAIELDRVYEALRAASFDRIRTRPTRELNTGGTSIRMLAGSFKKNASDLGNVAPEDAWTGEYDAASKALEPHLPAPAEQPKSTLEVRWDASMKGKRATVAFALGPDFAGVAKVPGTDADMRVGLCADPPRKVVATLRAGTPSTSTDVELDPAVHGGVEVVYDAETSRPLARAFAAERGAVAPPAEPASPTKAEPAPARP